MTTVYAGSQRVASISVPHVSGSSGDLSTLVLGDPATDGTLTYYHQDHLGGTQLTTDQYGVVTQIYDYYPYGASLLDENLGAPEVPYSFTGKELNEDSGLYYFEARWYDPTIGRFVSVDPMMHNLSYRFLTDPQSFNAYSYSRNNPIVNTDPTGLYTNSEIQWAIGNPIQAWKLFFSDVNIDATNAAIDRFPDTNQHNTIADAYRHAYLAASITRELDAESAYEVTTAHEIDSGNPAEETAMDMHNNQVGIDLASNPEYADLTVEELMEIAIEQDLFQTEPSSENTTPAPETYNTPVTQSAPSSTEGASTATSGEHRSSGGRRGGG